MDGTELLSPAGDFETAMAAFCAGADAVYCGLADFSARAFARNLSIDELKRLVAYSRANGKKVYVAFNTVVEEREMEDAAKALAAVEDAGPDALIVQDLGVARMCREAFPRLALHASTQLVAHNLEGVLALKDLGFERVVLARELSLAEVSSIARRCGGVELECFIHGALCYSISGLCLFSAMENGRSGNRGRCAYCCRQAQEDGHGGSVLPFSMKDLMLGEDALRLAEAGVASLKIEGRMKSALYVAAVTAYYRRILDGGGSSAPEASAEDVKTVFARNTTTLHLDGLRDDVVDPSSLGHLGAPIGVVKRVTKDRDGRSWLRFHTSRALERHDGLQVCGGHPSATPGGRHPGFGISEMRQAISRANVFEAPAGADVEVLLPEDGPERLSESICEGDVVCCTMSNAVKRRFPVPAFRPADWPGVVPLDVRLDVSAGEARVRASAGGAEVECAAKGSFGAARTPGAARVAAEKAFSKLGGTDYSPGALEVGDPDGLFVPISTLNELRREAVAKVDEARAAARARRVEAAIAFCGGSGEMPESMPGRTVKVRLGQAVPQGEWDEVVVAISGGCADVSGIAQEVGRNRIRIALPVYTPEMEFSALRHAVKRLVREGFAKWEASDLATLRLLRGAGAEDVTADWTLYAFNSGALGLLRSLGARRFVASPENGRENVESLFASGYGVEFLRRQSTPLFMSLAKPAETELKGLSVFRRDGLWITTRREPRTFETPRGASVREDFSWDA